VQAYRLDSCGGGGGSGGTTELLGKMGQKVAKADKYMNLYKP